MTKKTFFLVHEQARRSVMDFAWSAPGGWMVVFSEPKRNNDQNALLHSILNDISAQVLWHGNKLSIDVWKRLCMAAWLREKNEHPVLIPALDGSGFDVIFERTSKLNRTQCSELIEWCFAFGAEHGVNFDH